jgi:hypothetical protein
VLAVLASKLDPSARGLVAGWASAGAALLSAADLTTEGWVFHVADPGGGTAVIDGQRVAVQELRAVVTRRPAVVKEELVWVDPADRAYVAAEANAFLVAWLDAIPCPVVNRPTPTSLAGPAWGQLHWAVAAARAGVRWTMDEPSASHDVVVCGEACVGAYSPAEAADSRMLAREAGVELLGVRFSERGACAATPRPGLENAEVRAALLDHLLRAHR